MISKNFTKILSLAFATLIMTQALGQETPEGTAHTTKSPKRMISHVAQKRAIKTKDIIQAAVIGSVLFGSSFFVQDPNLKTALRVLAFAPMVVGFFMPQKFYQKFDKLDLELDEAGCSSTNYMCKGICADCRITKSYLAAIPVTLIPYAVYSFFTKKPTEAPAPAQINPGVQPAGQNTGPNQVPANTAGQSNQANQPNADPAAQNTGQNNANQDQEPAPAPAQAIRVEEEQNPEQPHIDAVANEQARPATAAAHIEPQQLEPHTNNLAAPLRQAVAAPRQIDQAPAAQQIVVRENAHAAQPAAPANSAPQPQDDSEFGALKSTLSNLVEGILVQIGYEPENNVPAAQPAAPANNAQQPDAAPIAQAQGAPVDQQPQRQGWGEWFNTGREQFDTWLARNLIGGEKPEYNAPAAQAAVPAQAVRVEEDQQPAQPNINAVVAEPAAEQARPAANPVQIEAQPLQPQENNPAPQAQAIAEQPQMNPAPAAQQIVVRENEPAAQPTVVERPAADNAPQPKDDSELGAFMSTVGNVVEGILVRIGYEPENNVPVAQPAAPAVHANNQNPAQPHINAVVAEPAAEQARPAAAAVQAEPQPLPGQENNIAPEELAVAEQPQVDPALPAAQLVVVRDNAPAAQLAAPANIAPQPQDDSELGAFMSTVDNLVEGILVRMGYEPENNAPAAQPAPPANNAQQPEGHGWLSWVVPSWPSLNE